ncbi:hypothetical protein ACTA71_000479 [Dictyostelium dimigraforme]
MKSILIILIFTLLNIINKSVLACNAPSTGVNCTSTLLYVPLTQPNVTEPFLTFNIPSTLSNSKSIIGSISLESINEIDQNKDVVKKIPFTNWLLISSNTLPFKYTIKTNELSLFIEINWSTNQVNSTSNYTSIQFSYNITKYQFQSTSNTLSLTLIQSLSDSQVSGGKTACGVSQLQQNSVFHQEVKLGDITLLGELNSDSYIDGQNQALTVSQVNKSTITTSSSIQTSQKLSINIPSFSSFAQFSTNYFPIKEATPITSTYTNGTICVSVAAAKTGRTQQEVAAICVGVIGFSIIGLIALHFFDIGFKTYSDTRIQIKMSGNVQFQLASAKKRSVAKSAPFKQKMLRSNSIKKNI